MLFRSLSLIAATLLLAPFTYAADGEGPGISGGDRPDREERPGGERPEAGALFAKFDHDKSGDISQKEFLHGLRTLMEQRKEAGGGDRPQRPEGGGDRPQRPEGGDRPKRPEGGGDRPQRPEGGGDRPAPDLAKHAEEVFAKSDSDGNGSLNEQEFRSAMGALRGGPKPPRKD